MPNWWLIFSTGLLTGGLTCLAVQGGLLAATIAQKDSEGSKAWQIVAFLLSKLAAYTLLGFALGWVGSMLEISVRIQIFLQLFVVAFMFATAMNLIDAHPFFRRFTVQPPKFLAKLVKNQTKSKQFFAPAILGAFTVFIPCGTTQAMMLLAVSTANPFLGAAVMFVFIIATTPLFFSLGYGFSLITGVWKKTFTKFAALLILLLALFNLSNAMVLAGSPSIGSLAKSGWCTLAYCEDENKTANIPEAVSEVDIEIENYGYSPKEFTIKAGSQVKINLANKDAYSCAQAFTIPKLKISKIVPPGKTETLTFTAPNQKGVISFMCSMGMYRGTIYVE